jgi:hypothetical protein
MRDPVFRAALAVANQDIEGVGEFCIRCHAPAGWFEGRSTAADGSGLTEADVAQGVGCDVCHRLVDPRGQGVAPFAEERPPGLGNGMMVLGKRRVARGPYADAVASRFHESEKSAFHASGDLCGTCHNVSHPLHAEDVRVQPPHAFGAIERTYSEWFLSAFREEKTCQACHYDPVPGGGRAARTPRAPRRDHFVAHGPVGGSTWVQKAVMHLWKKGDGLDGPSFEHAIGKAKRLLKTAASLELSFPSAGTANLRVTNLTGHKLPTGYPEGRRMWVNVRFLDGKGGVLREIGRYGEKKDTLFGESVSVPTLLDAPDTTVYECKPAMSEGQAKKHGKPSGPSFHFVLNDTVAKDNRIPPRGFANAPFAEHGCEPVGAKYADGQHWDDVELDLPPGCVRLEGKLIYQSVSWEYIRFLAEENRTDDWGKRLHRAWTQTGHCPPEVVAETSRAVPAR